MTAPLDSNELALELHRKWDEILTAAAMTVLQLGLQDPSFVQGPEAFQVEIWVDCPHEKIELGKVPPGRCVYRQIGTFADGKFIIKGDWV